MTGLTLVPTTHTLSAWLVLSGAALLVVTIASGIGEFLAYQRRTQTKRAPVRPVMDDLAHALSAEEQYRRDAQKRLDALERADNRRAAEVQE